MTPPPDLPDKDALIAALLAQNALLVEQNAAHVARIAVLEARVAELEAKLGQPPKTPDNSSLPPSSGQKPSGSNSAKRKAKPHAGAHRPLHPNPTSRREVLADATLKAYAADLERRLDRLLELNPPDPAGQKLQKIIKKTRRHLFVFVTNRELTATNNGSERALRPCAVYRKITNGFRSQWGAELYADIRSVVETARRRALPALDAIRLTLDGRPLPVPA